MKIIQTVEFTDEDRELLIKQLLPKDPCNGCNLGVGCCGCPEGYDYAEKVRPYKDANIYDIALGIRKIHDIKQNMKLEEDEIKNLIIMKKHVTLGIKSTVKHNGVDVETNQYGMFGISVNLN